MTNSSSKTVIFLGAGASANDGAPVQSTLFQEYFEYVLKNDLASKKRNKILIRFFKNFFDVDVANAVSFPTFEEILGILEIAINENENFNHYSKNQNGEEDNESLVEIHRTLVLLMAEIINDKLRENWHTRHNHLIDQLGEKQLLRNTSFISLNYDILIDNALLTAREKFGLDLDYGVNFINFDEDYPESSPNKWEPPDPNKSLSLFKLHGSLNWLYCPTCRRMELTPKDKGIIKLLHEPLDVDCFCKKCETKIVPIIIPPTYFKALSNLYLMQIWDKAETELISAERVIFCGYSFPDADIHVRYLFKRAQMRKSNKWKISLVNWPEDGNKDIKTAEAEKKRYERFLGEVRDEKKSFKWFSDSPELLIN